MSYNHYVAMMGSLITGYLNKLDGEAMISLIFPFMRLYTKRFHSFILNQITALCSLLCVYV